MNKKQETQVKSDLARGTDTLKCTDNETDCNPIGQQQPVISPTPECPDGNMTEAGCVPSEPTLECPDGNMTEAGCIPSEPTLECPDGNMTEAGCIPSEPTLEWPDGNMTGNVSGCTFFERNIRPIADAGNDQNIDEGSLVNLDGSSSYDIEGNITSYAWIQIGGYPLANLGDTDISNPSFTAPQVDNDTTMKFELTVTNAKDYFDKDDVNIIIRNKMILILIRK